VSGVLIRLDPWRRGSRSGSLVVDIPIVFALGDEAVALVEIVGGAFAQGAEVDRFSSGFG